MRCHERPHDLSRTDAGDDWLDAALRADGREHRADYLDDDGFTARVMAELPAPATLPAWRKRALIALWAAAGVGIAVALPGAVRRRRARVRPRRCRPSGVARADRHRRRGAGRSARWTRRGSGALRRG